MRSLKMYHVDITNKGNSTFQVQSKDYEFVVDVKGQGITPPDTLLASLGACVGVYIRKYAEGSKLSIPEFVVRVDADFCQESPMRFKEIKVAIDLKGASLDPRRRQALLDFIRNCPVHNTLKNNPVVEIGIV